MKTRKRQIHMTWAHLIEENPNLGTELDVLFPNDGSDTCRNYVPQRRRRSASPIRYPRKSVTYDGLKRPVYAARLKHIQQAGHIDEGSRVFHLCRDNPACGYEGHLHARQPASRAWTARAFVEAALKLPDDRDTNEEVLAAVGTK
jgi:hypothetical protein